MRKLLSILLLMIPLKLIAQGDTGICHSGPVTLFFDTTWNHHIMESDLILQVEVTNRMYCTGSGSYECNVLQVIKGEFLQEKIGFALSTMEWSQERLKKRFGGIDPGYENPRHPYTAIIGFKNATNGYFELQDKSNGKKYAFFMSEKNLTKELKKYFFSRFLREQLLPIYI